MKKSKSIEVRIGMAYMYYDSEFPYYSGRGRVLIRTMPHGKNIMVETQNGNQEPRFAAYYNSNEDAEAYARWMAMGL